MFAFRERLSTRKTRTEAVGKIRHCMIPSCELEFHINSASKQSRDSFGCKDQLFVLPARAWSDTYKTQLTLNILPFLNTHITRDRQDLHRKRPPQCTQVTLPTQNPAKTPACLITPMSRELAQSTKTGDSRSAHRNSFRSYSKLECPLRWPCNAA